MTHSFSIRRASLQDVEALVSLRLELERESGHVTQEQVLSDLRQATYQYCVEALLAEAFLVGVAEGAGTIVAISGLIFFQKPPSERNLSWMEAYILNMYTLPAWRGQGIATTLLHLRTPFSFVLLGFHALVSLLVVFPLFYHLPPFCKKMKRTPQEM
jgi:GNAT superfamily N-acetyltransferase